MTTKKEVLKTGRVLSKEDIIGATDVEFAYVECPEWGGRVKLRSLNSAQRTRIEDHIQIFDNPDTKLKGVRQSGIKEMAIAEAAIDEDGRQLFSEEDVQLIASKNAKVVDRLWEKIAVMSGIGEMARDEAAKN
jgi:hypothetical protein